MTKYDAFKKLFSKFDKFTARFDLFKDMNHVEDVISDKLTWSKEDRQTRFYDNGCLFYRNGGPSLHYVGIEILLENGSVVFCYEFDEDNNDFFEEYTYSFMEYEHAYHGLRCVNDDIYFYWIEDKLL